MHSLSWWAAYSSTYKRLSAIKLPVSYTHLIGKVSSEEIKNAELDHELEQEDVCKTETPDELEETPEPVSYTHLRDMNSLSL